MPKMAVSIKTAEHGLWVYLNGRPLYFLTRTLLAKALAHTTAGYVEETLDEVTFTTKGKKSV